MITDMHGGNLHEGLILDGYELIRPIGRGGFGEVWLCRSAAVGGYHALKFIAGGRPELLEKEFGALGLYRKEVSKHRSPNLVPIEHANRTEHGLYYVMPLADGLSDTEPSDPSWTPRTLAECIAQQSEEPSWFSSEKIIEIMQPILEALQLLSDAGLVHRDVKPENILFLNGRPCLGDISLLRADAAEVTRLGTPGYAAPSWYEGGHLDMYGVAATLYSLLTGNIPDRMGRSAFLWPPQGESSLSESERAEWRRLHKMIRRAREEKVSERYLDLRTMARALRNSPPSEPSSAQTPKPIPAPQTRSDNPTPPPPTAPVVAEPSSTGGAKNDRKQIVLWFVALTAILLSIFAIADFSSPPPVAPPQPSTTPGEPSNSATSIAPQKTVHSTPVTDPEHTDLPTRVAVPDKPSSQETVPSPGETQPLTAGTESKKTPRQLPAAASPSSSPRELLPKVPDPTEDSEPSVGVINSIHAEIAESPTEPFTAPKINRSPRDGSKGNSLTEDSRLAYNSLAWFVTEDKSLTPLERTKLRDSLARIDILISDDWNPGFEAAAGIVKSCATAIPTIGRSQNAELARLLLLRCDGDRDSARAAEGTPAFLQLGTDELAYRVELMNRLRMDAEPMLDRMIAEPDSSSGEIVRALMERARLRAGYGADEGATSDTATAIKLSAGEPAMSAWVKAELNALK